MTPWRYCLALKGGTYLLVPLQTSKERALRKDWEGAGSRCGFSTCQRASAGGSHWLPGPVQTKAWCDSHPDWLKQSPSSLREIFGLYISVAVCPAGLAVKPLQEPREAKLKPHTLVAHHFLCTVTAASSGLTHTGAFKDALKELEGRLLYCLEPSTAYASRFQVLEAVPRSARDRAHWPCGLQQLCRC